MMQGVLGPGEERFLLMLLEKPGLTARDLMRVLGLSLGHAYKQVDRLASKGLIESETSPKRLIVGGRTRVVYWVSQQGRDALAASVAWHRETVALWEKALWKGIHETAEDE